MAHRLEDFAARLEGDVAGRDGVLCPGPGHSRRDRSLSVRFDSTVPDGFIVHSFAGDDPISCRDHVRRCLGLPGFEAGHRSQRTSARSARFAAGSASANHDKARWLWQASVPLNNTGGETYLRKTRCIGCPLPPTMRFLPPRGGHPPAIVSAYAVPQEDEPGVLDMHGVDVRAVHLTRLTADCTSRTGKITLASPGGMPIVVAPWTDSLGLVICEGIEDALSAHEATGLPAWAAGSAPKLPKLAPAVPGWADCVTIIEDPDSAGRTGTGKLAAALGDRDIHVEVARLRGSEVAS